MTTLEPFHNLDCIGTSTNIAPEDMSEWSGDIELTEKAQEDKKIFDYLSDESNAYEIGGEKMPFPISYLEN